jgi:hypothetical protein
MGAVRRPSMTRTTMIAFAAQVELSARPQAF